MDILDKAISILKQSTVKGLESALLAASGLDSEDKIRRYTEKIDDIIRQLRDFKARKISQTSLTTAEKASVIHRFLWRDHYQRYNSNDQLSDVIDAEFQKKASGNCVGLSSLFAVLCLREDVGIYSNGSVGTCSHNNSLELVMQHSHVRLRLRDGQHSIEIENTCEQGFGAAPYKDSVTLPLKYLAAVAFNAKGTSLAKHGYPENALRYHSSALEIWPNFIAALEDRVSLRSKLGDERGAEADYTILISLNGYDALNYFNRGVTRMNQENVEGAAHDFAKAAHLRPELPEYHKMKAYAELKRGDYRAVLESCDRALKLDRQNADLYLMRAQARERLHIDGAKEDMKTYEMLSKMSGVCGR